MVQQNAPVPARIPDGSDCIFAVWTLQRREGSGRRMGRERGGGEGGFGGEIQVNRNIQNMN